jgi:SAM-dependent MidA family methyltransferase
MNLLEQKIREKIKKEGPIAFEKFMEMALYEPALGYYASSSTEIGKAGDFYTSQHVHQIFGAMIGRQIEEIWRIMGATSEFFIIEPGAGRGYMCKDILNYLRKRDIIKAFTYFIIETNPSLQKKQKELLSDFSDKVNWVRSPDEITKVNGCVLSNELLDSFPVHLIVMEEQLKQIYVGIENNEFKEIAGVPVIDALMDYIKEFSIDLPKGYRTEINLKIKEWIMALNKVLSEGFILTIDYGYPAHIYYSEERNRGTLLCYYKHQMNENPYENIGEQDITAHVNFSSVKKWGEEFGFKTIGFCQQGTYLVSLGIDEMIQELFNNSHDYLFEIARIKRLILPGTIGETHKVMIQYKGKKEPVLRGFSIKNQKDKL